MLANKELEKKWMDALRSGEYLQTEGLLHRAGRGGKPDSFCCLGVLCKVAGMKGVLEYSDGIDEDEGEPLPHAYSYANQVEFAPEELLVTEYQKILAELNDDGRDFNFIADVIEGKTDYDGNPIEPVVEERSEGTTGE